MGVGASALPIFLYPRIFLATELKTGKQTTVIFSEQLGGVKTEKNEKPALYGNTGMVDFAPRLDHVICHVMPMLAYIYIPLLYRNIQVE